MRKQLSGRQFKERLNHPAVDFCENADEGALDEGRYFVHLTAGFTYNLGEGHQTTKSCGSLKEGRSNLRTVTRAVIPQ